MISSMIVERSLFVAVGCEPAVSREVASSSTAGKAKELFADTPPLAAITKESIFDEANSAESETGGQQAKVGEARPLERSLRRKVEESAHEESMGIRGLANGSIVSTPNWAASVPATPGGECTLAEISQESMRKELSVTPSNSCAAEAAVPTVEEPTHTLGTAALIDGGEDNEKPLSEVGVAILADTKSEANTVAVDAGSAVLRDQATGISVSDSNPLKDNGATSNLTAIGSAEMPPIPSRGQTQGDGVDPEAHLMSRPAVPSTAATVLEGGPTVPRESARPQVTSQPQATVMPELAKTGPLLDMINQTKPQPEPAALTQGSVLPVSEPLSTPGNSPSLAVLSRNPAGDLGTQILDSMHASLARGDKELLIRLNPPELGSIAVRFQEQRGLIEVILEVAKDETRREVEQALPQALRDLQEAGIQIRRLDVVGADRSGGALGRDLGTQDGGTHRQDSGQNEAWTGQPSAAKGSAWTAAEDYHPGYDGGTLPQIEVPAGRVDMLI